MKTTFSTTILAMGNNTGIEVPPENIAELGSGKKPAVMVSIASYSYASTVAVMGDKYLIPLSKAHREASGLKGGDTVEVTLELETAPRTTPIPEDLAAALGTGGATERFEALAFSKRKE
ncbi:MAG TPA: DUF1905 domain-containing protein, partial [Chloroflexaceae bacterium]|nr:DUF1905 domain-containing protein [Chloroflexaceae bacterium]